MTLRLLRPTKKGHLALSCPFRRWSGAFALVLLASTFIQSLHAQTNDDALTKVKQVLALPTDAAEAETKKVRLQGVVVEVSAKGEEFALHDGDACVSVMVAGDASAPSVGDKVEIEGSVFSEPFFERKRTRVKASITSRPTWK